MNSQIVLIKDSLGSRVTFILLTSIIAISIFLKAGFISVSVIWFFTLCIYNYKGPIKHQLKTYKLLLFPIGLFVLYLLWLLLSTDPVAAVDIVVRKIHLLLIPLGFIIADRKITEKDLHIILLTFLIACLLCSFVCIICVLYNIILTGSLVSGGQEYYFLSDLLTDVVNISPVYFSMYCNLALLITLYTPFIKRPPYRIGIVSYLGVFIILCTARIGIIAMCVIFLVWLLHSHYGKNLFYAFVLALCAVAAFVSSYVFLNKDQVPSMFKFSYTDQYGNHTANQLLIWSSAMEAIKKNPLTGYGTGDGQKDFEEIYEKNEPIPEQGDPLNPHNEFFSATLDLGIAGGCLLIATLIIPFIRSILMKDPMALGFIVIIAFFFCVESVLIRQKGIVFFSFFYSLLHAHQANVKLDSKN